MISLKNITKLNPDILIIGSGIVGSSCALALSKLGYNVKVLDKTPTQGMGTSSYSSGICRMFYTHPDSVKLAWDSYQFWKKDKWEELIGGTDPRGMVDLNECGSVYLNTINSQNFINKTTKAMGEVGVPYELLDLKETRKILEPLQMDLNYSYKPSKFKDNSFGFPLETPIYGSMYMEKTGYISDPNLANQNLQYGSQLLGTEYLYNKKVTNFILDTTYNDNYKKKLIGVEVNGNETIYADKIINCSGVQSSYINYLLYRNANVINDMKITTRPMKQEVCYVKVPEDINIEKDGKIIMDNDIGVHFRPEVGNKLLIGNSEPPCDEFHWIDNLNDFDNNFSEQYMEQIYRGCLRMPKLPIPRGKDVKGVVSMYDVTEDWTPIYDKSNIENYFMAIGTSGNQFKNAPLIGELMSSIITNYNLNYHDYSPTKFKMKNFNNTIDLGTFSRLRKVVSNSNCVFS